MPEPNAGSKVGAGGGGGAIAVTTTSGSAPRPKQAARRKPTEGAAPSSEEPAKGNGAASGQASRTVKSIMDAAEDVEVAIKEKATDDVRRLEEMEEEIEMDMEDIDQDMDAFAADDDPTGGQEQEGESKGALKRLTRFFQPRPTAKAAPKSQVIDDERVRPEDRLRCWELMLSIRSMSYVGSEDSIATFFAFTLLPTDPRQVKHRVRLLPEYSPFCILKRNETKTLDSPFIIWKSKLFRLAYKDLDRYVLKVAMWKVSRFTFNTYAGRGERALKKIVWNDANMNFAVKAKLTKEQEEKRRKRRMADSDIAMLGLTVNCEEIFDFQLKCENWSLEMWTEHPLWKHKREKEKKALTFVVPRNKFSDPSRGYKCSTKVVPWKGPESEQKTNWPTLDMEQPFRFRGTRTALQNQCLLIKVHSQKLVSPNQPTFGKTVGCALMNLTSVLDISVFSGNVKDLQEDRDKFKVAVVVGNIKAVMCSMNVKYMENIKGGRPQQPKTASTVGHLKSSEQHLVVRVQKCDGLAVADPENASSDPYLRCTWDNMLQRSAVLKETIRPVFNFNFFFPVRLFNPKLKKQRYLTTALLFELESKGDLRIQVWDDDDTSSDSLGSVRLPLSKLLSSKSQMRTLRGPTPKARDDEEEEEKKTAKQWFEVEREVRVYDGFKSELIGCSLPNPATPLIYFEAYFYPDWPEGLTLPDKNEDDGDESAVWEEKEKQWNESGAKFAKKYGEAFPDAIGARTCVSESFARVVNLRRFTCIALHPQMLRPLPLMAFPCKIIAPEDYTNPPALLHWINCITFSNSPRQERTGEIPKDGWADPQTFLFTKKGPVQNHALLLASVLLGAKKDAYVCKGTIQVPDKDNIDDPSAKKLVEHVWVMTREQRGWVTFWETCTREMYHLPKRWERNSVREKRGHRPSADEVAEESEEEDEDTNPQALAAFANEIPDITLSLEELDHLPTVGRMPKAKARDKPKKVNPRDKMKADLAKQRDKQRAAPRKELTEEGSELLVDWLPYDSIDVIFNHENLWANRQNHHPACILYNLGAPFDDLHDGKPLWEPLILDPYKEEKEKSKWEPVNSEVVIDPPLPSEWIERREASMVAEMEENMRASRGKQGMDTFFDRPEKLQDQLSTFLGLLERMRMLDIDFCPCLEDGTAWEDWDESDKFLLEMRCGSKEQAIQRSQRFNKYGSPFGDDGNTRYKTYKKDQKAKWIELKHKLDMYREESKSRSKVLFEVAKGKVFTGVPVHFCTSDKEEIRGYILEMKEFHNMCSNKEDGTTFIIHCKMFPMLGGVQSTWLYIGMQEPMQS